MAIKHCRRQRVVALAEASIVALSFVLAATPGFSQCAPEPTVSGGVSTCSGVDTDGLAVTTPVTTVNVLAGALVTASARSALTINAPASSINNFETVNVAGSVAGSGTSGIALYNGTTSGFVFGPTATLRLTVAAGSSVSGTNAVLLTTSNGNTYGQAIGVIDNRGTLTGTSGIALKVDNPQNGGFASILNRSGGTIGAISGAVGILTNAGTIDGGANSAVDVGTIYNSYISSGTWANTGTITSSAPTATLRNVTAAITNGGTISNSGAGMAISGDTLSITNQSTGRITTSGSNAISATSRITLTNAGTITGNVTALPGGGSFAPSIVDSTAGTIVGNVSLGSGDDVVVASYVGSPTLATGISGAIDGGSGTNSIRIKTTQNATIATALQLPTGFQRLQLAPAAGTTVTLADGFVAPGTIALVGDAISGAGSVVNKATLSFAGQAITSQVYFGAASFTNQGTIRVTGSVGGSAALALDGVTTVANSGLIDVVGNGLSTSANGTTTNKGTIVSTGTTVSAFDNYFRNIGVVRSTGGTAIVLSGNVGNPAVNTGLIEGAASGVQTSIDLTNTGTINATTSTGTAVVLGAYGSLINAAGGIVGNGNGSAAVTASVFNSTVVNAGTINGPVSLTNAFDTANQRYISLPGGILNGNLTLGAGSLLVTDITNGGPGSFAGITGTVTAGNGSALRYRVVSDSTATAGPVGPFQNVSYELGGGATLTFNAASTRAQTLQLAGAGTVNLNVPISTTTMPAIQTTTTIAYPGGATSTGSRLAISSAGAISLVRAANSFPGSAVSLSANDSFTNNGAITAVDRQPALSTISAISGGTLVTNNGTIQLDGASAIAGATRVINTGTIAQAANGAAAQGIVNATTVDNRGTINVGGTAVQFAAFLPAGVVSSLVNSGSIISTAGVAVTSSGTANLDNSGTIVGSGRTAVQLGSGNDAVTLRTGSNVRGAIDGGAGINVATLIGSVAAPTASQTVAAFSRFNAMIVAGGYWTAPDGAGGSFVNGVTIASGAALEDANGTGGLAGVIAPAIRNNGTFVVRSNAASAGSTFGAMRIAGSGDVVLTGPGTVLLDGANSLGQTGRTTINDGTTAILTGSQGGTFVTEASGTLQIGNGGTSGIFTGDITDNGALVLNRSNDYMLAGAIAGSGLMTKLGAGTVTLTGANTFAGVTDIQAGAIKLATPAAASSRLVLEGAGRLDLSGLNQTVSSLAGSSAGASIGITGGALTVDQAGDTSFAGTITGDGSVTKSGSGRLVLTGNQSYSGTTTVSGGTMSVNGSLVSPVIVTSGGTLGGIGTVGTVSISTGGTYAPGNSIGTQTVAGNVTFAPGSTFLVEANAAGQADRINASGTATLAGTVMVRPDASGSYANLTSYTILTAAGGVTGRFDSVSSDLAFLTPFVAYGANTVSLLLGRNDVSFASVAADRNQASVATAIQPLGLGNPLYNAVLGRTAQGARAAFTGLSGEIHASLPTTLLLQSQQAIDVATRFAGESGDGVGIWGQALYNRIEGRIASGVAQSLNDQRGGIAGIDIGHDGLRAGVAGGYVEGDLGLVGRASHADIHSKLAIGYIGWERDAVRIGGGVGYSWHDIRTRRSVDLNALGGAQSARYQANVVQLYGKASYAVAIGGASIAPFFGGAYLRMHRDGFAESGSSVALTVARSNRDVETVAVGAVLTGAIKTGGTELLPRLSLSFRHDWGDVAGIEHATIGSSASPFAIVGTGLGRNALRLESGGEWRVGPGFRLGTDVFGETSRGYGAYGARGSISYRF